MRQQQSEEIMSGSVQKISSHAAAPNGAGNQLCVLGNAVGIAVAGGASPQTVAVTWPGGLPVGYHVIVTPSMKATAWVTNKTAAGFTLNLDNGGSISAGIVDVTVISA
jgi:hypothetical protein